MLLKYKGNYDLHRHYACDAGVDLFPIKEYEIRSLETKIIDLDIEGLEIPNGTMGIVMNRSSTSALGLIVSNSPIDSGYNGKIHAIITNINKSLIIIQKDIAIAQLVIVPILIPEYTQKDYPKRGVNNFGSTNKI